MTELGLHVGDLVRVLWQDHQGGPHGWHGPDELPGIFEVATVGWVVASFPDHVVICGSAGWDTEREQIDSSEVCGDATAIVRSCVRSVSRLEPKE